MTNENTNLNNENNKPIKSEKGLKGFFISIKDKFLEFYATKTGRIIVYCAVAFVALAALVGIIIGASTVKTDGVSELDDLSIAVVKGRLPEGCFIPADEVFKDYSAKGVLFFNKILSEKEMLDPKNDKYIVQYEITYTNDKGAGFIMTATCPGMSTLDPDKLNLTEEYKNPLYLKNIESLKDMPIYVKIEEKQISSGTIYSVTLCFEKDSQVFGVTTSVKQQDKIDDAINSLKINVIQIATNGKGGVEIL